MTKKEIFTAFDSATTAFMEALSGLDQEQINRVPFEGSWTAAQVGRHLSLSYGVIDTLKGEVRPTDRYPAEKRAVIESLFLDFNTKLKSPDFIIPEDRDYDKEELISELKGQIAAIREMIQTLDLSMTCMSFVLPAFGEFTRLEWVYFAACHTQRHARQILNIARKVKHPSIV
jgi:hypothetical protein